MYNVKVSNFKKLLKEMILYKHMMIKLFLWGFTGFIYLDFNCSSAF